MLSSMEEDYTMKTNVKFHAARDHRKWKAMTTYTHNWHGSYRVRETKEEGQLLFSC